MQKVYHFGERLASCAALEDLSANHACLSFIHSGLKNPNVRLRNEGLVKLHPVSSGVEYPRLGPTAPGCDRSSHVQYFQNIVGHIQVG